MNIMNKLTLRLLKENKRRTIVTIIGIVISVAMLTAVSTISVSFIDLLKRQEIADSGEWHALYKGVAKEQLEYIQQDNTTKNIILSNDIGYAHLEGHRNMFKPYLFLKAYNEEGFGKFPITLTDGRFPQAVDEIILSEEMLQNSNVNWKIGDKISLPIGQRFSTDDEIQIERPLDQNYYYTIVEDIGPLEELRVEKTADFTVVGIMARPNWERPSAPGYTAITYLDATQMTENHTINVSVVWNKVSKSTKEHATKLAKDLNVDHSFNDGLLRYYGVFSVNSDFLKPILYTLTAIIMTIILIGSVSLIYNAFAISVAERSRYLGMLASVGATKKQKRLSVYFEGAIVGLISIPLGIIAGLLGMWITFLFVNDILANAFTEITETLQVVVTPLSIIITILVSSFTIFISTYIPAKRASRISAIDAIRQTEDVKLTGKNVKTNPFVRKLFGIEAEFALKNLKRHKRRYHITVFSLVISIILFLSVSYFTAMLKTTLDFTINTSDYDMMIDKGSQTDEQWERLVENVTSLEEIIDYNIRSKGQFQADLPLSKIPDSVLHYEDDNKSTVNYFVEIIALKDENLLRFSKDNGIDVKQLQQKDKLNAILINEIEFYMDDKYIQAQALKVQLDDTIEVYDLSLESDETQNKNQLSIIGLVKEPPFSISKPSNGHLVFIVAESTLEQLHGIDDYYEKAMYLTSTDPIKTHHDIDELREVAVHIYNPYLYIQQDKQLILLLKVFTYGFVTLISAISVANIFNTISTSISLRRREFAMLKSIGMTPKGFNKMIRYESIFYGLKALLYGLPISIGIMYLMYRAMLDGFMFQFSLPWLHILIIAVGIFLIVGSAMLYSMSKVKKENIIDTLKQENV